MNLRTTLVLIVLGIAGGAMYWVGPRLPRAIDPSPPEESAPDLGTLTKLKELDSSTVTAFEIKPAHGPALRFTRTKGEWTLPGSWQTRQTEVDALLSRLCSLRSRFAPLPIEKDEDWKAYGLDQPAYSVTIETAATKYLLDLGEAESKENSFFRAVYARLGGYQEAVQLAPGTLSALGRPADFYQKRQLFPATREARTEGSADRSERLDAISFEAAAAGEKGYTLSKSDGGWRLTSPTVERIDPDKANQLREAIADLWAERFVSASPADVAAVFDTPWTSGAAAPALAWSLLAQSRDVFLTRAGLVKPERTLKVTHAGGTSTLLIGGIAGTRTKVLPPPPGPPGQPRQPQITTEEMRFARLENNDQVFEIKADKLKDLFVAATSLRDSRLARFETKNVRRIEVTQDGVKAAVLFRGDKEKDPWRVETPSEASKDASMLAEESKVTELLDKLSGLSGQDKETDRPVFGAALAGLGAAPGAALSAASSLAPGSLRGQSSADAFSKPLAAVKVTVSEGKDEESRKTKEITLTFGEHDTVNKLLLVKVDDWPRIELAEDAVLPLLKRPSLAYRGKLFDFALDDIKQLSISQDSKTIRFTQTDKKWRMVLPSASEADAGKVGALLTTLTKLEPIEYVSENALADPDDRYGLVNARLAVTINPGAQSKTLWLGKKRGDKPEYYARLHGNFSVFVIGADLHASLSAGSLSYLPLQLWTADAEKVQALRIEKEGGEPFELERKDKTWKLTKPVSTAASEAAVRSLLETAANPFSDRYEAHEAADPAKYGFDKPHLKLKLTLAEGPARELTVGKPVSKDSGDRYAKTSENTAVSVLRGDVVKALDRGSLDLIDTLLLSIPLETVQSIQSDSGAKFVLKPAGAGWKVEEGPGAPYSADENAVAALGGLMFNLRAERYAVYGSNLDLAKHGLDKPFATLTLAVREGEDKTRLRVLAIGGEVPGSPGQRYVRVDQANGIAILTAADTRVLTRTNLDYVDHRVLKLAPDKVTSLQRTQEMETLEIAKQDDDWQILKPQAQQAEDKAVAELLRMLSGLRASRVAEYPLKDAKKYGLDMPSLTLTVKLTGPDGKPSQHVLALGNEVMEKTGERYAKIDATPAVFVLSPVTVRAVQASGLTFRTRLLARFSDADKILLERGPRQAAFGRVGGSWAMTAPVEAKADNDQAEEFLNKAAKLEADELVADKPADLKPYGLDKPAARWRFQSDGKDVLDLLVGKLDAGGKRAYAKLGNGTLVFLLGPEMTKAALGEFREKTIFAQPLDAAQADTLKLTQGDKTVILKKAGAVWSVEGKPDTALMADTVNDTLAALASLKLERYAVDKGADRKLFGLDPPELVIEAEAGEKKTVLHIGRFEGDSKRAYAALPEKERTDVFVLSEADTARLTRDVAALGKPLPKK